MLYQVILVPGGGKFASGYSMSIWLCVEGNLGQTPHITIPKGTLQFNLEHRNLGVLSTMRIGSDSLSATKWFLDCVMIRNEITGHIYRFSCGRWFGRGVDDGSTERLLVADCLPLCGEKEDALPGSRTPPRTRSPSVARRFGDQHPKMRISEIQQCLGEAVNALVKHFHKQEKQRTSLTMLLCGDHGLVWCMEHVFLFGFRSSRFFKQMYPWDFVEKVFNWFSELLHAPGACLSASQRELLTHGCQRVEQISANSSLGKEGKFQIFVLITVKDRIFTGLLPLLSRTPITLGCYEEHSFFRNTNYLSFLTSLLDALNDYEFQLEKTLTWGIDA